MLPVAVAVLVGRFLPACKKARPDDVTGLNFSETLMVCLFLKLEARADTRRKMKDRTG